MVQEFTERAREQAGRLGDALLAGGGALAAAESCTGGWIAKVVTDVAGSSGWFEGALVAYSNRAKQAWLQVPEPVLESHGAVSEEVARAMVRGLLGRVPVTHGVAVTGVAGPGGGTPDKPVGTVWIAWGRRPDRDPATAPVLLEARHFRFDGDRDTVRAASVHAALCGAPSGWDATGGL